MNTKSFIGKHFTSAITTVAIAAAVLVAGTAFAAAPSVFTSGSPTITSTTATVSGSYNANGATGGVDARFDWGTTSALGNITPIVHYAASSGTFTATISGLSPSTTYYYRAWASNSSTGPGYGTALPFTTTSGVAAKPSVITLSQTNTGTAATFTGSFNGNGAATQTEFVYGPANGSLSQSTGFVSQSSTSGSFSANVTGLTANTAYRFQAVAKNEGGITYASQILPFTTGSSNTGNQNPCVINSFTAGASSVSYGSSATLTYSTTNCSNMTIYPNVGSVSGASNTISTGALYGTTTFTLTGTGTNGAQTTATATVSVSGTNGTGTTGTGTTTCTIGSFYALPATVTYGGSTTLTWSTYGNCANAYISNGVGSVGTSGSYYTGALVGSTYYTLTATDSVTGASITQQLFVGVTGSTNGTTGYGTTGYSQPCVINSFTASPTTVTSGVSATLNWTTSGCMNASISGGSLYGTYAPMSGSMSTGPLYGTTLFTLSANGSNGSTAASTTVSVTNSPYPYSYTCGYGSYDPSCTSQYSSNFITTPATNVGATTVRLNGLALNTPDTFAAYFEYGTNPSYLTQATYFQPLGNVTTYTVTQSITTIPNTTYYYRLVAQISGGATIRGNVLSFTTPASDTVNYATDTTTTTNSNGTTAATTNGVQVTVTTPSDKIAVGDTAEYTITYANGSGKMLKDVVLTIVLPQGFTVKQTTQGMMMNPTTVSAPLGSLAANQTGSVYIQAVVGPNTMLGTTLVTNATLAYTLPNGKHDSAVGYVLNHATASGQFAGFALGSGFFPSTIFGWFITIIIILIIILIARRISKEKHADKHGHTGGAHH